jgi:hypothetical protein
LVVYSIGILVPSALVSVAAPPVKVEPAEPVRALLRVLLRALWEVDKEQEPRLLMMRLRSAWQRCSGALPPPKWSVSGHARVLSPRASTLGSGDRKRFPEHSGLAHVQRQQRQ